MTMSHAVPRTANDRLKDGFELRLALSFMAAVLLHTLVFKLWPAVQVERWNVADRVIDVIPVQEYDLPADPTPLARPAVPNPTATAVSVDETMPIFSWRDVVELPLPRPADPAQVVGNGMPYTPHDVEPSLLNPAEIQRALLREYPPALRDAGIGGTIQLLVHIDAMGNVLEARVGGSSGMESLDAAALRVADALRFRPAQNRDLPVEVWIRLPVTFRVR